MKLITFGLNLDLHFRPTSQSKQHGKFVGVVLLAALIVIITIEFFFFQLGCSSGVKCWETVVSFRVIFSPFVNKNNNYDVSSSLLHIYLVTTNIILFVIIFWDEHLCSFPFMQCFSDLPVFMQRTSTYFCSCSISFPNFAHKDHVS